MGFKKLVNDVSDGHHHQLGSTEVTWQRPMTDKVGINKLDMNMEMKNLSP